MSQGSDSNKSVNDLDLSKIDNQDVDAMATAVEAFYKQDASTKVQLSWAWERIHLFLDGRQWLQFDGQRETGGIWKKLTVSKENEYIPRPTTNYIFDVYQTLKSYLIKNKPRSEVFPNTSLFEDKQAAKIGTLCCECNWERLHEEMNYEIAAANAISYGTVFKKDYWDTTALQIARIPRTEQVPQLDPLTGLPTGQMMTRDVIDPQTGDVVMDELPLGDVNTAIIEPYRMAIDPLAMSLTSPRWIMEYTIQPLSWIMEMFDKDPTQNPGYTGLASTVTEEKALSVSMQRFYDLKNSAGIKNGVGFGSGSSSDSMVPNAAVVKEYYERPSRQYPKGRLVVVANNITLYAGDSPYEGEEQGDWHPYSECRWELVPGRFWGKGPLEDAVEIQKQINSIDSVIVLTRKTMAIPQKLIPNNVGVNKGEWTGRPGQEVFYRPNGTGVKPETIPSADVGQQVFAEREQRLQDMKQTTGAIDILKGDRPPGVTAASALNMLYEVGTGKIYPVLDRWKKFIESSQKKQLKLISKKYKEPRPQFIAKLKSLNKELSDEAINKFIGSDLKDNCNVIVEAGSNVPKLQAAKQALLMELAQAGLLNLAVPENMVEFQHQLGVKGFDNEVGPDTRRAEWENDLLDNLANSPDNRPIVLDADQHPIHITVHQNRMKEPSFMSLPSPVQQAYMQHVQQHEQMQQMQMQAQMMQQLAMGGPSGAGGAPGSPQGAAPQHAPQHGPGPGVRGPGKGHSAGPTKEIKNALGSDLLTPATLGAGSRT